MILEDRASLLALANRHGGFSYPRPLRVFRAGR